MSVSPKNFVKLAAVAATVCAALLVFRLSDPPKPNFHAPTRISGTGETNPAEESTESTDGLTNANAANASATQAFRVGAETPPAHSFHVFYRGTRPAEYVRGDTLLVEGGSYLINESSSGVSRTVAAIPISAAGSITDTDSEVADLPR